MCIFIILGKSNFTYSLYIYSNKYFQTTYLYIYGLTTRSIFMLNTKQSTTMKTIYTVFIFLLFAQFSFSNASFCPDPPLNDDPCIESTNPPFDLSGGGTHVGTTCCARGPQDINPDGSLADFENVDCSAATEDAAVWYIFTPDPDDDGYQITLEGGIDPAEGPIAIEVYKGPVDQGCNGGFGETLASSCADLGVSFKIGNCFAPNEVLFVKISTDDALENCGSFTLTIVPASCGTTADNCIDLADQTPIEPVTEIDFSITYTCVSGCLDYACPEDSTYGGCAEVTQMPTVWFQIIADDIAAQMFTTVQPNGNWEPVWSIFSGPDCDNLTVVNFGGSPPCSNGDNTPELHQTSVFDDEENYWIMITVDPASLPATGLDDGSFELCVATTVNAIICLGELEGGACDDESLVMEVTDRELEDLPLEGPFAQGEEVTINISFFYDASESGADWLIGFVPVFGKGWDMTNFDYSGNAPVGNGSTAEWYEEGGDCAPLLQEPNPILCTFTDEDGNLQLCNQLCSPCSECPQQGMLEGDPLPGGYFWVSNGGNAGCDNDCSPGEGWGIGSTQAQIDWTFTLEVKVFDDFDDCFDNKDLSISFQTFSDGIAGCWEDPVGECILDRAMFSPAWEIICETLPYVSGNDQEICHDGVTDIIVQTLDGSTNTIIVEVEDNPNVIGEMEHTFTNGTGTIQDDLLNLTNDVQVVVYSAYVEDPTIITPAPINEIEVTVYPELMASFPPVFVCEGSCSDITPDIIGGIGAPYTYLWSTSDTSQTINICPTVPTTYSVTVTDALGCIDVTEVQVDVKPPVEISLPESIDVEKDDNFDPFNPDYQVCLDFLSGTSPYAVIWNTPPGLVGITTGAFGECFAINEVASSGLQGDNGQYILTASVTDFFGCTDIDTAIVNILGDTTENIDFKLIYEFFIDENGNGVRDSLEISFAEGAFYLEEQQTIYYNTSVGEDTLILEEGEFTLLYIPATIDDWILSTDSIVTVVLDSIENCVKVEFGLKRKDFIRDMTLSHFLVRRCNTFQAFYMVAKNNGTKTESGILWAVFDEDIVPDDIATSEIIDTFIAPNIVGWFFEDLLPGNTIVKTVKVYIPGPPDFPVGWVLNHSIYSELFNQDGTTEFWGAKDLSGPIQCGYDPNDKDVEPNHEEGYTDIDQKDLIYKIRFQNTGNAPAYYIQIRDTLSENLDVSSVQYIVGSHDEHLTFSRIGERILVFTFDNINLPDSTTDFEGSQGFLLYQVSLNEELPEGTKIENTAHIYFDSNPVVVTNTTQSILYPDLDNDGFFSIEDCDEADAGINPDAEEIPNNEVDEDCDGVALIIDNDMDGFNSDEDCDDENADINPDAEEIINNNVDENCDDLVVIIDNDMDGFNSDDDCDDDNPDINPDAEDIPGNGIDEDCDGMDAVISNVDEQQLYKVNINPNPSNDVFNISVNTTDNVKYIIRDMIGREVLKGTISPFNNTVNLGDEPDGLYLIILTNPKLKQSTFHKLLKI